MRVQHWALNTFDTLSLVSLAVAAISLAAAVWSVPIASEVVLMGMFRTLLSYSVASFLIVRCVEIFLVVRHTPAIPVRGTTIPAGDETLTSEATPVDADDDYQHAA